MNTPNNTNNENGIGDILINLLKAIGVIFVAIFGLLLLFGGTANNSKPTALRGNTPPKRRYNDCDYCDNCVGECSGDCDCNC